MINKFYVFRSLFDFAAQCCDDVTDADMNNYAGDIEITGTNKDGSTITITVELKEGNKDA